MKKTVLLLFVLFTIINCKNKEVIETEKTENSVTETEELNTPTLNNDCYVYDENGSKIEMQITNSENGISGNLMYQLKEKDRNTGTFKGILNDDILMATYTFQSEGTESTREIAFKITDNQLIEGYGEQITEGTSSKFKDAKSISFSSTMPLTKTDCVK